MRDKIIVQVLSRFVTRKHVIHILYQTKEIVSFPALSPKDRAVVRTTQVFKNF